jgi:hypothetical protein
MKNITFSLKAPDYEGWSPNPVPAIKNLPEWYKNTSPYTNGESLFMKSPGNAMLTVKKCVPFLEAMSAGYYILLNSDVFVDEAGNSDFLFNWSVEGLTIVESHNPAQFGELDIPQEYHQVAYKWINPWLTKTPKGYSCLFTHPQNIFDLPFISISGVVDTDTYDLPVNFPFLLKRGFTGIIPKGTPIAQVIPFKREDWKMRIDKTLQDLYNRNQKYKSYVVNSYRKIDWKRKSFK